MGGLISKGSYLDEVVYLSNQNVTPQDLNIIQKDTDFTEKEILNLYFRFYQLDQKENQKLSITQFLNLDELQNSPFKSRLIDGLELIKEQSKYLQSKNLTLDNNTGQEASNQEKQDQKNFARRQSKCAADLPKANFLNFASVNGTKKKLYKITPINNNAQEGISSNKYSAKQLNYSFIDFKLFCKILNVFSAKASSSNKSRFLFRIFDFDEDSMLSKDDLIKGITLLFTDPHTGENLMNKSEIERLAVAVFSETETNQEGFLKYEDLQLNLWETDFEKNCTIYF
ncbi:hypothetical protein ABPG72_005661 [Tetrahymena utriculariae]